MIGSRTILGLAVTACIAAPCATAALRPTAPDATLRIDNVSPIGSFSLSMWMVRDNGASGDVVRLGDLAVSASTSGDLTLAAPGATLTLPAVATAGDWTLLSLSWDAIDDELSFHAVSQGAPIVSDSATLAAAPNVTGFVLAADDQDATQGVYGITSIRSHIVNDADVLDVWATQHAHALYDLNTLGSSGSMNGPAGCRWMINHAITTDPLDGFDDDKLDARLFAASVGGPATAFNTHVYDVAQSIEPEGYYAVRPIADVQSFEYVSHFDLDGDLADDGFFQRTIPEIFGLADPPRIAATLPRAAQLDDDPNHLIRVLVSGNSRGVKGDDGSGVPGTFAYGFTNYLRENVAGVLNSSASVGPTPDFGMDRADEPFYSSGDIVDVVDTDFSRFWTGSPKAQSSGPGTGIFILPDAEYAPRCRAEGLIQDDAPLIIESYALRYPGASTLQWRRSKAHAPASPGQDEGATITIPMDTQTHAVAFDIGTDLATTDVLQLAGDHTASIVGEVVVLEQGEDVAISFASSISFDGARTVIELIHPLALEPEDGDTIRFGEWGFETIRAEWGALAPGDPLNWRGKRINAMTDGSGAVIFSHSAWRPDVEGFVIGSCGWSGNGYKPQLEESFPGAFDAWVQTLAPEVWLMCFAQQQTSSAWMGHFADALRVAIPEIEIVWLGDMAHGNYFPPWHRFILDNAQLYNVGASTIISDPRLGDRIDQYADGLRADESHGNARGNTRQARIWLEAWDEVAAEPCTGDATLDNEVNFTDLNAVLASFGQNGPFLPGDANADNAVDFSDLNAVLTGFGQPCD